MIVNYVVPVLSVGATVAVARWLDLYLQAAPVSLFICAVMFSAWLGGFVPGLVATVLSVLAFQYYFVPPIYSFAVEIAEIPRVVVFTLAAFFVGSLSARQRSATEALQRANDQLQAESTERKRAEEDARRNEAFLAEGQRLSHTGSWSWQVSDGALLWSQEIARITGRESVKPSVDAAFHLDDVFDRVVHPDDAQQMRQLFHDAVGDKVNYEFECRIVLPDRSIRHIAGMGHPVVNEARELVEMIGTIADVTERRAAEEEIRKQAELLNLAHDAVIVRDRDSRVTFWSRGAEETYGWTAVEAFGRTTHELLQTTFRTSLEAVDAALREQGEWEGELTHITRSGEAIVVASRQSLQGDQRGAPTAILEINRDITDRKRAEDALRTAEAELAHVTRVTTLGEVTASFAHEVNQPLAAIVNNASACLALLPDDRPDLDEVRMALADITSDAERASAIIERVRALAMRSPAEKIPLRVEDVVNDVVALTATESAARRMTIRAEMAADLPLVLGDRVQLQQVVLNLVVNGMDAMTTVDEQERRLKIRGSRDVQDGNFGVTISVQDQGIGLNGAEMGRLFEAFYTTKAHGMGMGLAISRSIIEMHGGRLWAEPNQGPGATFSFSVPAAPSTVPDGD